MEHELKNVLSVFAGAGTDKRLDVGAAQNNQDVLQDIHFIITAFSLFHCSFSCCGLRWNSSSSLGSRGIILIDYVSQEA